MPPPAPRPAPAAPPAEEGGLSLDFHIEPLAPAAEEEGDALPLTHFGDGADDDALPLTHFGDDDEAEDAGDPLPLMDPADFGTLADDEPLPLMTFDTPSAAPPAYDAVATLRARFDAAPEDADARGALVAALAERGLGYEAESLLEGVHRDLSAGGRFREAYDVVSELVALRPGDGALLQKRVEYAFRANDRTRLVPAYLALGEHLLDTGEASKGLAVFKRVLELDPQNPRARAVVPAEPQRAAAPAPAAAPAAAQASSGYVDLNALILDDVRGEQSTRFVVEEKEPTGDEDRDFADMLSHFRQKVSENIEVEDSASHYDLGVAFKEMGLLDEAIAEFQVALRGGSNPLATLEMLGQCFVEKGQLAVAARVLDRALRITGTAEGELIGVLYQLGRTEEAMGRPDAALDYYERVLSIDIRFRDAGGRAAELRAARGA
jgi:tetratricopeptide (TPR) repeat protein